MNQDMVFWGVIIALVGSIAVVAWLFYVAYRNATRDQDKKQTVAVVSKEESVLSSFSFCVKYHGTSKANAVESCALGMPQDIIGAS